MMVEAFDTDEEFTVALEEQVFETDDEAKSRSTPKLGGVKKRPASSSRTKPAPGSEPIPKQHGLKRKPSSSQRPTSAAKEPAKPAESAVAHDVKYEAKWGRPKTSGAFDFATWVLQVEGAGEELKLCWWLTEASKPLEVGSICSGISTESLALEAIHRACCAFQYNLTFVCESHPRKMKYLQAQHPKALHVDNVAELKEAKVRSSSSKTFHDKPIVDLLISGFSCKGLSKLNMKPESVLGKGSTGTTFAGVRDYVFSLKYEQRPKLIIFENVATIEEKHEAEGGAAASQIVADIMDGLGYTSDWAILNAQDFYLPQCRNRFWMVCCKRETMQTDMESVELHAKKMQRTVAMFKQFAIPRSCEPLDVILDRTKEAPAKKKTKKAEDAEAISDKSRKQMDAFIHKHGLVLDPHGHKAYSKIVGKHVCERGTETSYLNVILKQNKEGWNWKLDTVALSVGQSLLRQQIRVNCFSTVTPTNQHLVLTKGHAVIPSGRLFLALQGIQEKEFKFMALGKLSETLQQDVAGNAFTANVCIVVILSALLGSSRSSD